MVAGIFDRKIGAYIALGPSHKFVKDFFFVEHAKNQFNQQALAKIGDLFRGIQNDPRNFQRRTSLTLDREHIDL